MSHIPELNSSFNESDLDSDFSDTTIFVDYTVEGRPASRWQRPDGVVIELPGSKNIISVPLTSSTTQHPESTKRGSLVPATEPRQISTSKNSIANQSKQTLPMQTLASPSTTATQGILHNHSIASASGDVAFSDPFRMSRSSNRRRSTNISKNKESEEVVIAENPTESSRARKTRISNLGSTLPTPVSLQSDSDSAMGDAPEQSPSMVVKMQFPFQKRKFSRRDADSADHGEESKRPRRSERESLSIIDHSKSFVKPRGSREPRAAALLAAKAIDNQARIGSPSEAVEYSFMAESPGVVSEPSTIVRSSIRNKRASMAKSMTQENDELAVTESALESATNTTRTSGRKRNRPHIFGGEDIAADIGALLKPNIASKSLRNQKRLSVISLSEEDSSEDMMSTSVATRVATGRRKNLRRAPVPEPEEISHDDSGESVTPEPVTTASVKARKPVTRKTKKIPSPGFTGSSKENVEATSERRNSSNVQPSIEEPPLPPRFIPRRERNRGNDDVAMSDGKELRSTIRKRKAPPGPSWADRNSEDFDLIRFLGSEESLAPDHLLKLPGPNHSYLDKSGNFKDRHRYTAPSIPNPPVHPKLAKHYKNGTDTMGLRNYYRDMPPGLTLPIAGIILTELPKSDPRYDAYSANFLPGSREFGGYDPSLYPDFDTRIGAIQNGQTVHLENMKDVLQRNVKSLTKPQEESFQSKAMVKLLIPDYIKAILVDDWENVTKNQQLVPLPASKPVETILSDYLEYEKPKRAPGPDPDILDEVISGLKEYFEKCLGRILLYRFERPQYIEVRDAMLSPSGELANKSVGKIYGAEHLCRLIVTLPELIGQTNMDHQSVNRLKEELTKLTLWLEKNAHLYFTREYETPAQEYVENARSA